MKFKLAVTLLLSLGSQISVGYATLKNPAPSYSHKSARPELDALVKNVQYEFCKAEVPLSDRAQLDKLAAFLATNNYAVSLRGHADAIGTYVGNWKMSEARAEAVKTYLIKKGVAEDKIVTTAFGSTVPIANNKTMRGRQKNRRVEIRLKEIGG